MTTSRWQGWLLLAVLGVVTNSGCFGCLFDDLQPGTGGGAGGGNGGDFSISGRVMNGQQPGPNGRVEVRRGATVLGSASATSGFFSLSVDPGGPATLLVTFRAEGFNPVQRTVKADRSGSYDFEAQAVALQALACGGTRCSSGGLDLDGVPAGTTGFGRAFNPVTETAAFPGGFDDSDGNLLLSGAFATVELKDAQGQPLTTLAAPATLTMPFPKDTWPLLVDLAAGDGKVTVPLYAFEEALATWKRDGEGELVDGAGALVPESAIAAIRQRTHQGPLFVRGQVTHFSTWNVDWPISSHGCITGRIVTAARAPQANAKVEVEGVTYTGRTGDLVTGADGRFCADVLRSEAANEDVDNNGVRGQTQRVAVYVTVDDDVYNGGEHQVPTTEATCGGACLDLGDVVLDATSQFTPALCSVTGTLVEPDGTPIVGLQVSGFGTLSAEELTALCPDSSCYGFSTASAAGGAFSGTVAVKDRLMLAASRSDQPDARTERVQTAYQTTRGCPRTSVVLQMGPAQLLTTIDVTVSGQAISWSPPVALNMVAVESSAGDFKWGVVSSGPTLTPPLTYGVTPSGATALPGTGGALASGDEVAVQGTTPEGSDQRVYTGTTTVP